MTTRLDETTAIDVRPLKEGDLAVADRIMRLAFGTFLGLPNPGSFMGDGGYVRSRWRADPAAAFGAFAGSELVGSNFATNWGSVAFFGPLTTHPELWDRGIGKLLMAPVIDCFDRWQTRLAGLYTFPHSRKHVGLYQRFGFWPQFLTAIMSRPVRQTTRSKQWTVFSELSDERRHAMLDDCRRLTDEIYAGLDVSAEFNAVAAQDLGDTVLLRDDAGLTAFAVCHCGPDTEAGGGNCYIKFGAARPGAGVARNFRRLLGACEQMAATAGLSRLVAGVNTARHEAYREMLDYGFRSDIQGIAMHRPNESGYSRPGIYVIDDWR